MGNLNLQVESPICGRSSIP